MLKGWVTVVVQTSKSSRSNTLTDTFNNNLMHAVAQGTMDPVDAIDIKFNGSWGNAKDIPLVDGGDGAVNYALWRTSWIINEAGTISAVQLGVKGVDFLEKVYSEVVVDPEVAVNIGDVITVEWKITAI